MPQGLRPRCLDPSTCTRACPPHRSCFAVRQCAVWPRPPRGGRPGVDEPEGGLLGQRPLRVVLRHSGAARRQPSPEGSPSDRGKVIPGVGWDGVVVGKALVSAFFHRYFTRSVSRGAPAACSALVAFMRKNVYEPCFRAEGLVARALEIFGASVWFAQHQLGKSLVE